VWRESVEPGADRIMDWQAGGDRGVPAAQVLHERVPGDDGA
jgi:hypothetical protein